MKPRPELLLAIVLAAGLTLLLLDAGTTRGVKRQSGEPPSGTAPDPPAPELVKVVRLESALEQTAAPVTRAEARSDPGAGPASPSPTHRGRLVDEATLEPIPEALVATSVRNDWTDANGWFDTGDVLDELDDLLVVNVGDNTSTHEVPKTSWTRLPNAWQVPISIGPTYRLRFRDVEVPSPETWEARLQRDRGSDKWHRLRKGPPPYLRFDEQPRELGPGERVWLEARSLDGLNEGRGDVSSLVGIHEVEIDCRPRAVLRGRVVDEKGLPWRDLGLEAVQLSDGAEEDLRASTGVDGTYQFSARDPGQMRLVLELPWETRTHELNVAVPPGVTQAPDLVVERRPMGSVKGRLQFRTRDGLVSGRLRLRALDGSGYVAEQVFSLGGRRILYISITPSAGSRAFTPPTDALEFSFEDIPTGAYELSACSEEGYACSPACLRVRVPSEGHVFSFENAVELRRYALTLIDAESGAVLDSVLAETRAEGAWSDQGTQTKSGEPLIVLAQDVAFEWRATSPGYRIARGTQRDFELEGDLMVATRSLRRGFGLRLLLLERNEGDDRLELGSGGRRGAAVAGAEILADGELVATSDANGIAYVEVPSEPARIEVRLAGWRVLDSPSFRNGRPLSLPPTIEVWMVRE